MRITISHRLQPFSHVPGTYFVLPGSMLRFQIFPAFIRVHSLAQPLPVLVEEIALPVRGPVKNFTVLQDLERTALHIWGHTAEGYMRYRILPSTTPPYFCMQAERFPNEAFPFKGDLPAIAIPPLERLSLGCHKGQDWTLIQRRRALEEILPIWFRLGQLTPETPDAGQGCAAWLRQCEAEVDKRELAEIVNNFYNLIDIGFEGGLSPRLDGAAYYGFTLPPVEPDSLASPLALLTRGAALIRRLFFHEEMGQTAILPCLPPLFHAGRLLHLRSKLGLLDLEWSKKQIRRMILTAAHTGEASIRFQSHLKQFRMRRTEQEKGIQLSCNEPIALNAGEIYYFDRFEK